MNFGHLHRILSLAVLLFLVGGPQSLAQSSMSGITSFDLCIEPISFVGRNHGLNQSEVESFAKSVFARSGIKIVDSIAVVPNGKLKRPIIKFSINDREFDKASLYIAYLSLVVIENASINGKETNAVIYGSGGLLYTEYNGIPPVKQTVGNAMTSIIQEFAQDYKRAN